MDNARTISLGTLVYRFEFQLRHVKRDRTTLKGHQTTRSQQPPQLEASHPAWQSAGQSPSCLLDLVNQLL